MTYGQQPGHGRSMPGRPGHPRPGPGDVSPAGSGHGVPAPYGAPGHARPVPAYAQPGYPPPAHGPGHGHGHGPGHGHGHGPGGYPQPYGSPYQAPPPGYGAPPEYAPPFQHGMPAQYDPSAQYGPPSKGRRRRAEIPTGGPITDEDERWAVPAYVGMFVVGFLAPLIVYVVKRSSSPFARFHATQALNLSIAMTACGLVGLLLAYATGAPGLLFTLGVVAVGYFCIIKAAIGANRCEWYRLPSIVAWPIVR